MMRANRRRFWLIGGIALLGYLAAVTAIVLGSARVTSTRVENDGWETHTRDVMLTAKYTLAALESAETGERGFIITSRPSYLEPYETGRREAMLGLDQLASLTQENPAQQARIADLRPVITTRLGLLAEAVAAIRAGDAADAVAIVQQRQGQQLMQQARAIMDGIEVEEQRLLEAHHTANMAAAARERDFIYLVTWFGALTLLAALLIFLVLTRASMRSQMTAELTDRLRLFVNRAPVAIAMFDLEMRYLAVSRRYVDEYRLQHEPANMVGLSHYDVFPTIPENWREVHRRVLAGESMSSDDDSFTGAGGANEWLRWQMSPWHHPDGSVGGAMLMSEIITARKRSERRQALLLGLAAQIRAAPRDTLAATAALLARYTNVSRVGYAEMDEDGEHITVLHAYTDGSILYQPSRYLLVPAVGAACADELRAGRTVAVTDVLSDPRTHDATAAFMARASRSTLMVPLIRDGVLRATFYLSHHDKRAWTEDEVQLVEEVAAWTLASVEESRLTTALKGAAEEFRTLADGIPTMCWMARADGHIYWYNRRWYEYTGKTFEEMEGWGWQSLHDPDVLPGVMQKWRSAIATASPFEMTFPLRGADGVLRPFITRIAPVLDGDGEVRRWLGVNIDVSEPAEREAALRRSEAALRISEARLQTIFNTAPVGICIGEAPSGRIVARNQQAKTLYGDTMMPPTEAASNRPLVWFHADGRPVAEHEQPLSRALAGERHPGLEARVQRPDGTLVWIRHTAAPIFTDGHITGAILVSVDIDRETRAMQQLAEAQEGLEVRIREEVHAREAAQIRLARAEKMTALGQLAGGIAHDFNNVMQAVSGGATLIHRHASNTEMVTRLSHSISEAVERGASITRRLLAFAHRGELKAAPINVAGVLESLQEILSHSLGGAVLVDVRMAEPLPAVLADQGQLETVLVNLATNARDAMPDGGTITISAALACQPNGEKVEGLAPGAYVRFEVADPGIGMDAATLARVTEPFFTTKPQGKGTGLGLSMARGFAEQSGGAFVITSEPGVGTTVKLWLPIIDAAAMPDGPCQSVVDHARPERARILLVDDEALVREILAEELSDFGFDVVQAESGPAGLAVLARDTPVDVIVSDLSMPHMNGVTFIHTAQERRPRLPAILLTGYAGAAAELAVGGAVTGSFSLLRKPTGGAQLADRISTLLETTARD